MFWRARRRIHVIVRTAFASSCAGVSGGSLQPLCCADDGRGVPWCSSYLRRGEQDQTLIGNRKAMNECYLVDVRNFQRTIAKCPTHVPLCEQLEHTSGGFVTVRILSWNINFLSGPDGTALQAIDPDQVAKVIGDVGADVVCLQETLTHVLVAFKDYFDKQGIHDLPERMARLDSLLKQQGHTTLLRSCSPPSSGMPALIATNMPVLRHETFNLAAKEADKIGMAHPRTAAYVELSVGPRQQIGLYSTHLHHINHSSTEGQRFAEVNSLLQHAAERNPERDRLLTLLAADFNQTRQADYSAAEWQVVAQGLSSVKQPEDDGVATRLDSAGWLCTYDMKPVKTNFGMRQAPAFTHWTGTTVDYTYLLDESLQHQDGASISNQSTALLAEKEREGSVWIAGSYIVFSELSDHLPIVTDITFYLPA